MSECRQSERRPYPPSAQIDIAAPECAPRGFRELLHQRVDAARVAGLHVAAAAPVPRGGDVFLPSVAKHGAGRRLVPFGA